MDRKRFIHYSRAFRGKELELNDLALNSNLLGANHLLPFVKQLKEATISTASNFNSLTRQQQIALLKEEPLPILQSLFHILQGVPQDQQVTLYVLTTMDGIICQLPKLLKPFSQLKTAAGKSVQTVLKGILAVSHNPAVHQSAFYLLAKIAGSAAPAQQYKLLMTSLGKGVYSRVGPYVAAVSLVQFIKHDEYCRYFLEQCGDSYLRAILENGLNDPQLVYYCLMLLWCISFTDEGVRRLADYRTALLKLSARAIQLNPIEKVMRIGATLFLALKQNQKCVEILNQNGVLKLVDKLLRNGIKNDEVRQLVEELGQFLQKHVVVVHSKDRLIRDIKSMTLTVNKHSQKLVKDSIACFEDNQFQLVKVLEQTLAHPVEEQVIAAIFYLGEFGKYHPFGYKIMETLKAKASLMKMVKEDGRGQVRQAALNALQKIVGQKWQLV